MPPAVQRLCSGARLLRTRFHPFPRLRVILAIGLLGGLGSPLQAADDPSPKSDPAPNSDASCFECHNDPALTMKKGGRKISLSVDTAVLPKSAHSSLSCIDCHEGFDDQATPHKKPMTSVDCVSCHDQLAKTHRFHLRLAQAPIPTGQDTDCIACHKTHDTVRVSSPEFVYARARQTNACGECHDRARDQFLGSAHGRVFKSSDKTTPSCLTCHKKLVTRSEGQPKTLEAKQAEAAVCESCHVKDQAIAGQALRGVHFVGTFDQSVHGIALARGEVKAANCVDCHGAHEMDRAFAISAKMNKRRQPQTCGRCHEKIASDFEVSVHAAALAKGNLDSPACTDCHGEHEIRGHKDPTSPIHERNVAQQVCATCHASVRLNQKYGLASHTFETFSDSYHGLAMRGGGVEVVNCASCHSSHGIKSHLDPTSTVYKANLIQTCGQCHPGANTRFTVGSVHVSAETVGAKAGSSAVLHLVANLYVLLIGTVVGSMAVHNGLDFLKKLRRKLAIQRGDLLEHPVAHRLYMRMTAHERLQHASLVLSFTLLVITGFMLRYPEAWWVVGIRNFSRHAFEWRSWIHRIAGIALIVAGCWHLSYLAFTAPGRSLFRDLLPRKRDLTDPWNVLRYNLGLSRQKPAFPRFSYIEKVEYWALVWGTLLMGLTGAILWFENTSMGLVTKLGYDISRTVHFYEAILATLAIVVWHFYFVIFNPDVYPMNLAWLTGRMSEREMDDEHPLELERLKAEQARREPPPR